MSKPNPGSRRYLKAQLRPLTRPIFWAAAGLFGLSLFTLSRLFRLPDEVLSNGDRDAVVNLDENESLTPEERARAAEIDDLSVLLKDLDKRNTIDSVSGRLNEAQTTNLKTPEAIKGLEIDKPSISIPSSSSEFKQLPRIKISTPSQASGNIQTSGGSGFVGFDPRSSGQVNGTAQTDPASSPLAAALERQAQTSSINSVTAPNSTVNNSDTVFSAPSSNTPVNSQPVETFANDAQFDSSPSYDPPATTPTAISPTPSYSNPTPDYSGLQRPTPQNSSDNAYSQLLNPNLVVPSAPLSPTLIPPTPAKPATSGVSSSLGKAQANSYSQPSSYNPSNTYNSGAIAPTQHPQTQSPVFGAPSQPATTTPRLNNPAPYSVPNTTPGQHSGNGKINTFANP